MRIIIPKGKFAPGEDIPGDVPVYFLAGPIRGGGDWQARMCDALLTFSRSDFVVACPCRWDASHRLAQYFVRQPCESFDRQLAWEQRYLTMAGRGAYGGCVIFWLGEEDKRNPHPGPEPYAMDTRGELGEWRMRMKHEGARVVLGAEHAFHGLSQIRRNFDHVMGCEVRFHNTIESTARAAIQQYGPML